MQTHSDSMKDSSFLTELGTYVLLALGIGLATTILLSGVVLLIAQGNSQSNRDSSAQQAVSPLHAAALERAVLPLQTK